MIVRPVLEAEYEALADLTVAAYRAIPDVPHEATDGYEEELRDVAGRVNVGAEVVVAVTDEGVVAGGVTYVPDHTNELAEFELHTLTAEPEVPVYVGCDPDVDSNELAEFVYLIDGNEKGRRPLAEVDPANPKLEWALSLTRGDYRFRAEFAGGPPRESPVINVRPIHKRIPLKAGP